MYRVAVLEDDAGQRAHLERMVASSPHAEGLSLSSFANLEELEGFLGLHGGVDILLADICLLSADGARLSAVDFVESCLTGTGTQVIYVTGYDSYHSDVYRTEHAYFLLKPFSQSQLDTALQTALARIERASEKPVRIHTALAERVVLPRSIVYVESDRRVLHIHAASAVYDTYMKLDELERALPRRFVRCHKSFLVNMEHIREYRASELALVDGTCLPVSQSKRKAVREAFFSFVRGVR